MQVCSGDDTGGFSSIALIALVGVVALCGVHNIVLQLIHTKSASLTTEGICNFRIRIRQCVHPKKFTCIATNW